MNGFEIVAIVLVAAFATAGCSYIVFKLMRVDVRRRHLEVGTAVFLQLGVIYAVFLAFVFGQALTSFVAADNAIDDECAALHGAAIVGASLPATARTKLATALENYLAAVIGDEWKTMRTARKRSAKALAEEEELIRLVNTLDLSGAQALGVQSHVVSLLLDAHKSREQRLFEAAQGIPVGLWAMILAYSAVLVGLVFFSSLEYAMSHAAISGIFGGLNALILLAVFALQYPFEGPFRLSPETFIVTQAKIAATFSR